MADIIGRILPQAAIKADVSFNGTIGGGSGMKHVELTQSEFDALETVDSNTIYFITNEDGGKIYKNGTYFGSSSNHDNTKTEKHLLGFDGTKITDNGSELTYDDVYAMLMESPDFVVLVYEDRAYHPNVVKDSQIVFISSFVSSGYERMDRISMLPSGDVTVTYGESESVANKTNGITDLNKDSDSKYPTVKAVVDYVATAGSSGGGNSDWNAKEGEAGYIKNRPFYETIGSISEILHDGTNDADNLIGNFSAYKISDQTFGTEDLRAGKIHLENRENGSRYEVNLEEDEIAFQMGGDGNYIFVIYTSIGNIGGACITDTGNAIAEMLELDSTGLYGIYYDIGNEDGLEDGVVAPCIYKIEFTDPVEVKEIKKIDKKFLPKGDGLYTIDCTGFNSLQEIIDKMPANPSFYPYQYVLLKNIDKSNLDFHNHRLTDVVAMVDPDYCSIQYYNGSEFVRLYVYEEEYEDQQFAHSVYAPGLWTIYIGWDRDDLVNRLIPMYSVYGKGDAADIQYFEPVGDRISIHSYGYFKVTDNDDNSHTVSMIDLSKFKRYSITYNSTDDLLERDDNNNYVLRWTVEDGFSSDGSGDIHNPSNHVELTQAEFDALGTKDPNTIYFVDGDAAPQNVLPFRFGIDENGNYGYYKAGADTITPFKTGDDLRIVTDDGMILPPIPDTEVGKIGFIRLSNSDVYQLMLINNDKIAPLYRVETSTIAFSATSAETAGTYNRYIYTNNEWVFDGTYGAFTYFTLNKGIKWTNSDIIKIADASSRAVVYNDYIFHKSNLRR